LQLRRNWQPQVVLFLQQGTSRIGHEGHELATHGLTQLPLMHVAGLVQALPQPPQLLLSVCSSTQAPLQRV
jgi:hypothetical protein